MIPAYFGYHTEDFDRPFWCALDFTVPSIIVPNIKCESCDGQKYESGALNIDAP